MGGSVIIFGIGLQIGSVGSLGSQNWRESIGVDAPFTRPWLQRIGRALGLSCSAQLAEEFQHRALAFQYAELDFRQRHPLR